MIAPWSPPIWGPIMPEALLSLAGLQAWYGESHVLHGVDLEVRKGELVTLVGRNGAGKSTTMKSIMGLVGKRSGSVKVEGAETIALQPYKIARQGIELCPEERGILASLDVEENLLLPPKIRDGGLTVEQVFTIFLVEQNLKFAGTVADRHYVMERGKIVDEIANAALQGNMDRVKQYRGV